MNELKILLILNWRLLIGGMKYSGNKRSRLLAGPAGLAVIAAIMLFSMGANAKTALDHFLQLGRGELMLYSGLIFVVMMEMMLGVLRGATPSTSRDSDLLLSLPLSRRRILLAKSITRYLFELAFCLCFFAPYPFFYLSGVGMSAGVLFRCVVVTLALPLLSVGLADICGYLFFKLGSRLPNPQTITSVLTLGLVGVFLYFNFNFTGRFPLDLAQAEQYVSSFAPARWGMDYIAAGSLPALGGLFLLTVVPFSLGNRLRSSIYGQRQTAYRSSKRDLDMRGHSPVHTLLIKEAKRYFSSTLYLTNTIIGPLVTLALPVLLIIGQNRGVVAGLLADPLLGGLFPLLLAAILGALPATAYIAACSISLEGRQLWILRSLPLRCRDIFAAKIGFNLIIAGGPALIAGVASAIILGLPLSLIWMVILLPLLTVAVSASLGLYINLVWPKLDWDNEAQVVKQSLSSLLSMFIGFFTMAVPLGAGLLIFGPSASARLIAGLWLGWDMLLLAGAGLLLAKDGARRFAAL